ncbi:pyridoxamine 5'-phosphate oxidase family protein [Frankia sp. AgB1.9]|uniref:pyridoxamine 5'-phosphate oxidase family protein n=1 Tax=unclassified Frankia TaxID=2632575 RepID=UPI001931E3C9|nr:MULTISPECIES: pyridoxamine 5'-phosphate oxidase family protein [unclassified Frankia]MBL7494103.1 pyridoxamine 5'-phosphate oxidase family protein [Frankia sp. AgW1.1]MBL7553281.1 pyridoxamine 5'-phosphate oxidase family protein [Frankia sp. AgB1.9]MBL7625295.1 pyridoxamine 5'-phosphate oxidase family protein [Frankia sp. AgB1.8]
MGTQLEPIASRPYMPGYGTLPADEGGGLLPWSWAVERLAASHDYWLATVRPDGRPHVMPVWGVWLGDALWFSSGEESRKARNLSIRPFATLTTDNAAEPVVVEGRTDRIRAATTIGHFTAAVNTKYRTDYPVSFFTANVTFRLRPSTAFALTDSNFTGSPTRWAFA